MKDLHRGQIVVINGGKYHGIGAHIRQIYHNQGYVDVLINGKLTKLKLERVTGGAANGESK